MCSRPGQDPAPQPACGSFEGSGGPMDPRGRSRDGKHMIGLCFTDFARICMAEFLCWDPCKRLQLKVGM